jgi:XTP/dITP diphosphohydrolase
MKEIVFVTTNQGKIKSAEKALKNIRVLPYNAELIEPRGDDIKEIAKEKVKQAYAITKTPCIALDSGFFIEEWNGFPRAYVNPALETLGVKGILKLMENVENRSCKFKQCLAYYDGVQMEFFESESPGRLSTEVRESSTDRKWSELWHIFMPLDFNKTLSEFSNEDFEIYNELREPSGITKFGEWYNEQK